MMRSRDSTGRSLLALASGTKNKDAFAAVLDALLEVLPHDEV